MITNIDNAADLRLRRRARRNGYLLRKSRRTLGADNHGGYRIVDTFHNAIISGEKFDLSVQDVEEWFAAFA